MKYPHSSLLKIEEIEQYYEVEYHASWKFSLGNEQKGCIVRVVSPAGPHTINSVWMYVLDTVENKFVNRIELARNVGEELYFSTAQSWIKDIDGNGVMDVLMRTRNEEAGNTGLSLDADDTLTASVMKDGKWMFHRLKDYPKIKKDHSLKQMNIIYP